MNYEGDIIRPPSEAGSIILQATVGCSHNRCTFCGAFRDKVFRIKDDEVIDQDIEFAARYCRRQKNLFLADGNGLAIPRDRLLSLLKKIRLNLPWVRRISTYANARDILRRSPEELSELKNHGLLRLYMGLETGHDPTLQAIDKGATAEEMIKAGQLARQAGIFLSVTVLLGIGGHRHSREHALATAKVLNRMQPGQIAVLTLMLIENTPLAQDCRAGGFSLPGRDTLFHELRTLLLHLDLEKVQFQANHASNYFDLDGRLPRDRDKLVAAVDRALAGTALLKPESTRAL